MAANAERFCSGIALPPIAQPQYSNATLAANPTPFLPWRLRGLAIVIVAVRKPGALDRRCKPGSHLHPRRAGGTLAVRDSDRVMGVASRADCTQFGFWKSRRASGWS